jgi:N-dimethylarginine dimethylaminohydrolase
LPGLADALYTHDPVLVTNAGALILLMGKSRRRGEEERMGACIASNVGVLVRAGDVRYHAIGPFVCGSLE